MASFVLGIGVTLLTFYLAFLYASAAIGLLGCAEAVLLALAFLYLLLAGRRVRAAIRIPIATAEQGDEASLFVDVENQNPFPCMKIRYRLGFDSVFQKRAKRRWYSGCPVPRGRHSSRAKLGLSAAGNYTVALERLRIYDLTGLFYRNLRVGKSVCLQVLPEIAEIGLRITENTRSFFGDSDVYDDFRPGNDRSEIFDVREFRAGDKIQSIHWKLSAKSDELVVREDSQPLACPVAFVLDGGGLAARDSEAFLSVAASLIFSLMAQACPHYVSWYSGSHQDMVRARVDDEEGYYLAVCAYMEDCSLKPQTGAEERYREKYRCDRPLHMLVLKSNLTLWQNGERRAAFDRENWKNGLEKLELIL